MTADHLQQSIDDYISRDDVFRPEFLEEIILTEVEGPARLTKDAAKLINDLGTRRVSFYSSDESKPAPPPGPYFVINGVLLEAWKLFDDVNEAFMSSLRPDSKR